MKYFEFTYQDEDETPETPETPEAPNEGETTEEITEAPTQ